MSNSATHFGLPFPVWGACYSLPIIWLDADGDPTDPVTPDTEISKDGGGFVDCTNEVTVVVGGNGAGWLTLTSEETKASVIWICAKVASGPKATLAVLFPRKLPFIGLGTAQAGSADTITLGIGHSPKDNYYVGAIVRTTGGTGGAVGGCQARVIYGYVGATRVATIGPNNWEVVPGADTTVEIPATAERPWTFLESTDLSAIPAGVWAYATRELTSFGTLATSIAAAVWSYVSRTLTAWLGGAKQVTFTLVDADLDPVGGCRLQFRSPSGQIIFEGDTGIASGQIVLALEQAASYTVLKGPLEGYVFATNPQTFDVGAATTQAITLTAEAEPVPSAGYATGLTYLELMLLLKLAINRRYPDTANMATDSILKAWIRAAHLRVDRLMRWTRGTVDLTTAVGDYTHIIVGSIREILAVEYVPASGDTSVLDSLDHELLLRKRVESDDNGTPTLYSRHGQVLYLYPPPDTAGDTVRLWVVTNPVELSLDSDKPSIPGDLHQFIVDLALAYVRGYFGDARAAENEQVFVEQLISKERHEPGAKRNASDRIITGGL